MREKRAVLGTRWAGSQGLTLTPFGTRWGGSQGLTLTPLGTRWGGSHGQSCDQGSAQESALRGD